MSKADIRLTIIPPRAFMNPVDFNVFDFTWTPRQKKKIHPLTAPGATKPEKTNPIKRSNSWSSSSL